MLAGKEKEAERVSYCAEITWSRVGSTAKTIDLNEIRSTIILGNHRIDALSTCSRI
jgi:hypothetical protein